MADVLWTSDGGVEVRDGDRCLKFDKTGKFEREGELSANFLSGCAKARVVSVLTSSGGTDIYKESKGVVAHESGTVNAVMDLTKQKGYLRRLRHRVTVDGVSATQTIFLYGEE